MNMSESQIKSMHLAAVELETMPVQQRTEVLIHSHRIYFDMGRWTGIKLGLAVGIIIGTLFAWIV